MAFTRPRPPGASTRALEAGLKRYAGESLPTTLAASRAELAVQSVSEMQLAIRLFRGTLEAIVKHRTLSGAVRPVGWRYFVPGFSRKQAAEVVRRGRRYEMGVWTDRDENRRFLDAVARLESEPSVAGRSYQLRCLEVRGLNLEALWAFQSARDQLFVPISLLPVKMTTGHVFTLEEFHRSLRLHAKARLGQNDAVLR